jgi:hypothetical protein
MASALGTWRYRQQLGQVQANLAMADANQKMAWRRGLSQSYLDTRYGLTAQQTSIAARVAQLYSAVMLVCATGGSDSGGCWESRPVTSMLETRVSSVMMFREREEVVRS